MTRGRLQHLTRVIRSLGLVVLISMMAAFPQIAEGSSGTAVGASRFVPRYSSFIGGPGFDGSVEDIAFGAAGHVYIVGSALNGIKTTPGVIQPEVAGGYDGYLMKFDPEGDLVFSTYLGGAGHDRIAAIAIGADDAIYVSGGTFGEFPTTPGAFQTEPQSEVDPECWEHCPGDGFVAKISSAGTRLEYSTYLGAEQDDGIDGIAVDAAGRAYVAGSTDSENFPTTPGALQRTFQSAGCDVDFCKRDVTVSVLDATGAQLVASTYFGGSVWDAIADLAVDPEGNIVIGGLTTSYDLPVTPDAIASAPAGAFEGYIAKLSPDLQSLVYSTFITGSRDEMVNAFAVDSAGTTYVTGFSSSRDLPVTFGSYQPEKAGEADAFVLRLSPAGGVIEAGTFFGGSGFDGAYALDTDPQGDLYVAGYTRSVDFPTTRGALETRSRPGDIFLARFDGQLQTVGYSSLLGGGDDDTIVDLKVDGGGGVYLGGATQSRDFPLAGRPLVKRMRQLDGTLMYLVPGRYRTMRVTDDGFSDRDVSMSVGGTIRWVFRTSKNGHAVKDATGAGLFGSGRRPRGAAYYFTFDVPGTYRIVDPWNGKRSVVRVVGDASWGA